MKTQKLEWVEDYSWMNPDPIRRGKSDDAMIGTETIKYKKGQIITVEEMGGGNFRDVDANLNFWAPPDLNKYRLL